MHLLGTERGIESGLQPALLLCSVDQVRNPAHIIVILIIAVTSLTDAAVTWDHIVREVGLMWLRLCEGLRQDSDQAR